MNKKKIISSILLFFVFIILKIFLSGFTFYHFFEELIPLLFTFSLINIFFITIPFFSLFLSKKRKEYSLAKKICFWNSVFLYTMIFIPNIIIVLRKDTNTNMMSIDPVDFSKQILLVSFILSILYYFINCCFFVKNLKE